MPVRTCAIQGASIAPDRRRIAPIISPYTDAKPTPVHPGGIGRSRATVEVSLRHGAQAIELIDQRLTGRRASLASARCARNLSVKPS
jgi:hypothetical protein